MKTTLIACALTALATAAGAQSPVDVEVKKATAGFFVGRGADVLEPQPLVVKSGVRNSPFSAEAVTEFTQVLGDGNRIERTFSATVARDAQGRTRREQEIAMVGPLAQLKTNDAKLVVITDPIAGVEYTLDEQAKTAQQSRAWQIKLVELEGSKGPLVAYNYVTKAGSTEWVETSSKATIQPLGTRTIEGVPAEGTRMTTTIAAGAVGNVNAIDVVTERWYSKDLQMDVLISRRDPRNGDTIYRLRNIVRAEPPADLFVVPADYKTRPVKKSWNTIDVESIELKLLQ